MPSILTMQEVFDHMTKFIAVYHVQSEEDASYLAGWEDARQIVCGALTGGLHRPELTSYVCRDCDAIVVRTNPTVKILEEDLRRERA